MKLGAERNKIILLAVLTAIAGYSVYTQFLSGPEPTPAREQRTARTARAPEQQTARRRQRAPRVRGQAFRPNFGASDSDEPLDPMTVDPTLRVDLLAKVRGVEFEGVQRNLFRFGERKKPQVEGPSPEQIAAAQERLKNLPKPEPAQPKKAEPQKPTAPPIKWKYYGFANSSKDARKRAFLLGEEDEVLIATEGDVFKKRYRIVRIGVNSIVIEDMQFKDEQTLPLEES